MNEFAIETIVKLCGRKGGGKVISEMDYDE